MAHKYKIGQDVFYRPSIKFTAAPGIYKIVRTLPVENEGRLTYRIKSAADGRPHCRHDPAVWSGYVLFQRQEVRP